METEFQTLILREFKNAMSLPVLERAVKRKMKIKKLVDETMRACLEVEFGGSDILYDMTRPNMTRKQFVRHLGKKTMPETIRTMKAGSATQFRAMIRLELFVWKWTSLNTGKE